MEVGLTRPVLKNFKYLIMEDINASKRKRSLKEFFKMGEVGGYFFRGKDPSRPNNINIRMMHGVNRISIIIFLAAFIFWLIKRLL
jgi:hypothetical protein